jgi:hypothetical protein
MAQSAMLWNCLLFTSEAAAAEPEVLRFASGLRVVVEQREGSPRVATAMLIGAGEGDAPAGQEHVAHLAEHLSYRSSADGVPHDARLHALACEWNAYTDLRHTAYLASCPDDATDDLLDLEAARLADPFAGVADSEVAVERDVLTIEVEGHREPGTVLLGAIVSRLDPEDPAALRLARSGVGALAAADVRGWTAEHYQPTNAVLAIVSPRSAASLRPGLEARFGPVASTEPVGGAIRVAPARRATLRMDVRRVPAPVEQPMVLVSFDLPPGTVAAGDLLGALLQHALHVRFTGDARVQGLSCGPLFTSRGRAITCAVVPAAHLEAPLVDPTALDTLAGDVRARLDVRDQLRGRDLARAVTAYGASAREAHAWALDELGPVPYSWPDQLGRWMLIADRPPVPGMQAGRMSKAGLRQLRDQVLAALDPQRSLVLLLVPEAREAQLPEPRPRDPAWEGPAWPPVAPIEVDPVPVTVIDQPRAILVQRTDLIGAHKALLGGLGGAEGSLLVIGPMDPAASARALPLPGAVPPAPEEAPIDAAPVDAVRFVAREGSGPAVAELAWSCRIEVGHDAAAHVASEILGARMYWTVRRTQAWSYSPEAGVDDGALVLRLDALEAAVPDVMAWLRDEVGGILGGSLPPEDLAVAVRRASVRTSTRLAWARDWPALAVGPEGWRDAAGIVGLAERVADVDAAAVAAVLAGCDPRAGWVVTGSAALGDRIAAKETAGPEAEEDEGDAKLP